ncbi:MAG: universal stress protein [Betaproteobacteria bacterium HGW-Betaproteobacteria-12]|nr:MAG: universal stress protein [Betaproteobacteria bacterium HGW-Betaproteobacteria-12]
MYKHILVPTDGSSRSERATKAGVELAKALGARITGLYVTDPTYVRELDEGLNEHSDKILDAFAQEAKSAGIPYECIAIRGESPHAAIIDYAEKKGCDVIVMGTHGRSRVGKLLLGSTAASLLADCDIPVLIYR